MSLTAPILNGKTLPEPAILGHFLPWFTQESVAEIGLLPDEAKGLILPKLEPWRHWRDSRGQYLRSHLYQPAWGEYDSRDPQLIRRQIMTALDYGLDGFIINLYGRNSVENVLGLIFLRELRKYNAEHPERPLTYIISLDAQAQWPTEGKTPVSMAEDFAYLKEVWCQEACLRRDGRFPFLVFPYDRSCPEYRAALTEVFGPAGFDLLWSGSPNEQTQDAAYAWVRPFDLNTNGGWFNTDDTGERFLREFYAQCNHNPKVQYLCGGVWPGFNDQLVRWAWSGNPNDAKIRPRVMCRHSTTGSTLERTWQAAADYILRHRMGDPAARVPMSMIQIVTWNDWAEATQVEPSCDLGYSDLEVCKRYSELLKQVRVGK